MQQTNTVQPKNNARARSGARSSCAARTRKPAEVKVLCFCGLPARTFEAQEVETGSGRVFSESGIWPKYGAGFGKMQNILTGFGIWLLPGKRDSPNLGTGCGILLPVCREFGKSSRPKKPLQRQKRINQASAKYQSKGLIYILNLLAFAEISLF